MAFPVINPFFQFFDDAGEPLASGTVETYEAGTSSTPKVTYQEATLTTPNATTIDLDAAGRCSMFVGDGESFKYIVKDADGVTVDTQDGVKSPSELTAANIGAALYPRTAAEIAAGVTPVNSWFNAGDIRRYKSGSLVADGSVDWTEAIQAALDQRAVGGDPVYVPRGSYLITSTLSYPLSTTPMHIRGEGMAASIITTELDIECLTNAGADDTHGLSVPIISDMAFHNTYPVVAGAGSTKFHIHLKNPLRALIRNVHCRSAFGDTDHNDANHGGVWFESIGGYGAAFMNTVDASWMQNCQINIETSDTIVQNTFVWGHPCQYAIRCAHGNGQVLNCPGIIGSPSKGGVYLPGPSSLNTKISNNFFDGSFDTVNSGFGVFSENGATFAMVVGNSFWRQYYNAIYAETVASMTIVGNQFWDCGRADSADTTLNADIAIESQDFQSNSISVVGNVGYRGATRSNQGAFIVEINNGNGAVNNRYIGNTIYCTATQYKTPSIETNFGLHGSPSGSISIGNVGRGSETEVYSTFTGTLTGCTTSPTQSIRYNRQGNIVTLNLPASLTATSNATSMTITGMPAGIRPANTARGFAYLQDNGSGVHGSCALDSSGVLTFYLNGSSTGFTSSGTKGMIEGFTLVYELT